MTPESSFAELTKKYHSVLTSCGCVIVGFSGGADSSCLLRLMHRWCSDNSVPLAAAHVNHMIRGEEADLDEEFARSACRELGVQLFCKRIDVPALAKSRKLGLEEAARMARYDFFDEVSEKLTGSPTKAVICTAHNADDNLETVLLNLLRGSGLHGLCGIDPLRGGRFLRPLLYTGGGDIRQWCAENSVSYRVDSTNSDTSYARNHIRHNIVPELAKICPSPTDSVTRMTSLLLSDDDFLSSQAEAAAERYLADGGTAIPREAISQMHPSIASRVLRKLYDNAKDSSSTIEEKHIREILRLTAEKTADASLSLPGKMRFVQDRREVRFEFDNARRGGVQAESPTDAEAVFTYPNDGEIFQNPLYKVQFSPKKHICHTTDDNIDENIYKLSILLSLRFDKIKGVLQIRYRSAGDVVHFGGHTHKVRRMLSDKKLTPRERALYPILCDDCGIVWLPGYPPRDGMEYREGDGGVPLYVRLTTFEAQPRTSAADVQITANGGNYDSQICT